MIGEPGGAEVPAPGSFGCRLPDRSSALQRDLERPQPRLASRRGKND